MSYAERAYFTSEPVAHCAAREDAKRIEARQAQARELIRNRRYV